MVRDVRSGAVDNGGNAMEATDSAATLPDTDTCEGMGPIEGCLTNDINDSAFDEAMPEVTDDATTEAHGFTEGAAEPSKTP